MFKHELKNVTVQKIKKMFNNMYFRKMLNRVFRKSEVYLKKLDEYEKYITCMKNVDIEKYI